MEGGGGTGRTEEGRRATSSNHLLRKSPGVRVEQWALVDNEWELAFAGGGRARESLDTTRPTDFGRLLRGPVTLHCDRVLPLLVTQRDIM